MPITVRELALDLLAYLSPAQRTMPPVATQDDPFPQVLRALNSAKQKRATTVTRDWIRSLRRSLASASVG